MSSTGRRRKTEGPPQVQTALKTLTIVLFAAAIDCAHQTPPSSAPTPNRSSTATFPLAAAERDRERELRARFAQFWRTATGDRRTVYDTFIAATPLAEGVVSEQVEAREREKRAKA